MQTNIDPTWYTILKDELNEEYFQKLTQKINLAYKNHSVFPTRENIFNAFRLCPFDEVRVVILGQDPYHAPGQAHGLAFSVPDGVKIPPSLRNIYKEINADLGVKTTESGNLEHWAKQGVLLLNTTLTVEAGQAGSHQGLGWETFTDTIIKRISYEKTHIVFLLWGASAIKKSELIDASKHLILTAPHPSPLSAHRGFLGCRHFSQTNEYLKKHFIREIDW
ncbi:uracil-DNA glycosylase [Candidatus Nomurabacteria bacterium]|nr:uracil-DNA glycosylase [Candidatus Nomurabacteria bacterium]